MLRRTFPRFMSDRLNRICLKVIFSGSGILFFLYILNHFIRPFIQSDRIDTAIYFGSLILFYLFFFAILGALILLLMKGIRKSVFPK
ncbi:MAG: hypothetical protein ACO1N0_01355 [Fluviicola sp.]